MVLVDVGEDKPMFAIRDLSGLLELVQASVLEIHPWGSTLQYLEQPDRITFDLDPGEGVDWSRPRRRGSRGARAPPGASGLRAFQDNGRQGPPRGRAAAAQGGLGGGQSVRAGHRRRNDKGLAGPIHGHDGEARAGRADLCRLPPQRPRCDGGRRLLDPGAPRRAGLDAPRLG